MAGESNYLALAESLPLSHATPLNCRLEGLAAPGHSSLPSRSGLGLVNISWGRFSARDAMTELGIQGKAVIGRLATADNG